jgi:hypothetical protein
MEVEFANCVFTRSDEYNVSTAVGRLSLSQEEGEGEGLLTASWKRADLNPSPQSSPLVIMGEAEPAAKCLSAWKTKSSWLVAQK